MSEKTSAEDRAAQIAMESMRSSSNAAALEKVDRIAMEQAKSKGK